MLGEAFILINPWSHSPPPPNWEGEKLYTVPVASFVGVEINAECDSMASMRQLSSFILLRSSLQNLGS